VKHCRLKSPWQSKSKHRQKRQWNPHHVQKQKSPAPGLHGGLQMTEKVNTADDNNVECPSQTRIEHFARFTLQAGYSVRGGADGALKFLKLLHLVLRQGCLPLLVSRDPPEEHSIWQFLLSSQQ
jgi:hypothetical protein